MKPKSVFIMFLVGLLALAVLGNLSSPVAAQKSSDGEDSKPVKNADYWFNRGALCATYGNDTAAIEYFQKSISLDPNRSGAYFSQGISYGQLNEFDKALALIDKAIAMEPQNGLFVYGRARVQLLAGNRRNAMADFRKAAQLDDEDAQAYLRFIGQRW